MSTFVLIILGILVGIAVLLILSLRLFMRGYNELVYYRERVLKKKGDVEVQLKRKYDLIPALIATVREHAGNEKDILPLLTQVEKTFKEWEESGDLIHASLLDTTLQRILLLDQKYPHIHFHKNYYDLINEIKRRERRVAEERLKYNELVRRYNTRIKQFPLRLIAQRYGFTEEPYYVMKDEEEAR